MIHIVAYKASDNKDVSFLFNPDDGFLYRDEEGKKQIMGRPENFIFPHVPLPQNMKTWPAKKLTLFCKDWIESQGNRNGSSN